MSTRKSFDVLSPENRADQMSDSSSDLFKELAFPTFKQGRKNRKGIVLGTDTDTHGAILDFGKYKGKALTRVPVDYLHFLINKSVEAKVILSDGSQVLAPRAAQAELERRGERIPDYYISHHAIDRASIKFFAAFQRDSETGEGLSSWLSRKMKEVILTDYTGVQTLEVFISQTYGRPTRMRMVICFDRLIPELQTVK